MCCLLVLNLVSSTPPCIRQPGLRIRVLGVCDRVQVCTQAFVSFLAFELLVNNASSDTLAFSLRLVLPTCRRRSRDSRGLLRRSTLSPSSVPWVLLLHPSSLMPPLTLWLSHFASYTSPRTFPACNRRPFNSPRLLRRFTFDFFFFSLSLLNSLSFHRGKRDLL